MAIYKAAQGARYGDKQAKALGSVLEKIGFSATPKQIVDAARPATSPIHKLFEWNNTRAAEKFRLWQARDHANHLQVVIVSATGERRTRAFHSVVIRSGDDAERAYCHMENIAENADLSEQVIAKALAELNGWKARYSEYKAIFSEVFQAIDKAEEKVKPRKRRKKVA